jgi:hypothetical protein
MWMSGQCGAYAPIWIRAASNGPCSAPIVQAYCAELGIPYLQTSLVESYRQALTHLHEAGAPLRKRS